MGTAQPAPERIAQALGVRLARDPVRVSGGQDAAIWRLEEDGKGYALRVFPVVREAGFLRELAAIKVAAGAGLPVPGVRAAGAVDGSLAMVIDWCDGEPMLAAVSGKPWWLWRYARLLGQLQARLQHTESPPDLREGAPGYWLRRSGDGPIYDLLLERGVRTDALIHLDFHPLNVMVEDGKVSGIIDWTNSAAGDPRADFAMTAALLSVGPIPPGPLRPVLRVARRLLYGAWRGAYEKKAGRVDDDEVAPFMAWAGMAMLREMEPRALSGRQWPTLDDLRPIREWVSRWSARAGIAT